jgi:hypothetical protein
VRYVLAAALVETDRDSELARLLKDYDEEASAAWDYTKALAAFRRAGDDETSRRLLSEAIARNPHVPAYLLRLRTMPKVPPAFMSPGEEDEAICFMDEFGAGWARTPGAIDWLRARRNRCSAAPAGNAHSKISIMSPELPQRPAQCCQHRLKLSGIHPDSKLRLRARFLPEPCMSLTKECLKPLTARGGGGWPEPSIRLMKKRPADDREKASAPTFNHRNNPIEYGALEGITRACTKKVPSSCVR